LGDADPDRSGRAPDHGDGSGSQTYDQSAAHCNGNYCDAAGQDYRESAFEKALVANIAIGVGAAGLIGGAVLWLTAPAEDAAKQPRAMGVSPIVGANTAMSDESGGSDDGGASGGSPIIGAGGNDDGSGASPEPVICDQTPAGSAAPCSELPDGTPIEFPGGSPQGPCTQGIKLCQDNGTFESCLGAIAPAQTDRSTNADENCDGTPDNTQCGVCSVASYRCCYDGPPGTQGVGACQQGTQIQLDASGQNTVWGPCAGQVTPAPSDTCQAGNDATCNEAPNEDCICLNGDSSSCGEALQRLGNCAAGTTQCVNGVWAACSVTPAANDGCNQGDDATCNGYANEGCQCLNNQTRSCGISYLRSGRNGWQYLSPVGLLGTQHPLAEVERASKPRRLR
jgi:hypothetical protein